MSKIQNPFQKEDWIEEMIKQAPEFKQFQNDSFQNFKAIKRLEDKKHELENRSCFFDIFQVFTTHALTASLTAMLCLGGVATFAAEKTLPVEFKPSTLVNKINPFAENLKGGRNWYWQSSSSSNVFVASSSSVDNNSSSSISSLVVSSSSSLLTSSSTSVAVSSLRPSSSSQSTTQSKSSSSNSTNAVSSKSSSFSSVKKEQSADSAKSSSDNSKFENIKLKFGEDSKDKGIFTMKDNDGNIYSFNNIKGVSTDLFDLKNPDLEYIFSGNASETIIDRAKYPAIKWKIFNIKESLKLEKAK
jgi:hypothetical protein